MSATVSRSPLPTSSRRNVTGWPPSCTTATSHEWRVRSDGFSKYKPDRAARQRLRHGWGVRSPQHLVQLVGREVVDLEEVAQRHEVASGVAGAAASTSPMTPTAASISASPMSSEGARRSAVGRHGVGDDTGLEQGGVDGAGRRGRRARRRAAGPSPRTDATSGRAESASVSRAPAAAARPRHVLGLHRGEDRASRRGGERLAAVRGGVVARLEHAGDVGPRPARADRHAVAERLGHGHDVGPDVEVLEAEPAAGPAEAGLHLVDHEQQAPLVAQAPHALEVVGVGRVDPALALHGLEQHRRHRRVDGGLELVEVVPGHVAEALGQRLEHLVLGGLPGGVEGGERASVEAAVGGHDHVAAATAEPAGQLDGALVGLGAGVAEEHLAAGGRAVADQPVERRRHLWPDRGAEEVRHVQQRAGLGGERVGHGRVGVAERGHGQPRQTGRGSADPGRPRGTSPRRGRTSPVRAGRWP